MTPLDYQEALVALCDVTQPQFIRADAAEELGASEAARLLRASEAVRWLPDGDWEEAAWVLLRDRVTKEQFVAAACTSIGAADAVRAGNERVLVVAINGHRWEFWPTLGWRRQGVNIVDNDFHHRLREVVYLAVLRLVGQAIRDFTS